MGSETNLVERGRAVDSQANFGSFYLVPFLTSRDSCNFIFSFGIYE